MSTGTQDCELAKAIEFSGSAGSAGIAGVLRRDPMPVGLLHTRVVTGTGGGPDKTILNSPRHLVGTGYEAHCAYLHPPGDPGFETLRERARDVDAPLHGIPDRGAWDASVAVSLLRLCRRLNVQIWHAHDYKSNLLGLLLRPFHRMHLVTTVHGWGVQSNRTAFYYWLDRRCLPQYDMVACVSDDLFDAARNCGVPASRCVLLENGIELDAYRRSLSVADAKRQLGLNPHVPVIGAAGRLSSEKGFDLLIDAVSRLHRAGHVVDLVIAGEGDYRASLEQQIAAQPHPHHFQLLGFQPDLRPFYQALDVFALSSRREGLPNVLLEAMALETPVVATRVGGVPRLVEHGETGLLAPAENVDALADRLLQLLTDRSRASRLAQEARNLVATQFSFAARMQREVALYDQLCGKTAALCPTC